MERAGLDRVGELLRLAGDVLAGRLRHLIPGRLGLLLGGALRLCWGVLNMLIRVDALSLWWSNERTIGRSSLPELGDGIPSELGEMRDAYLRSVGMRSTCGRNLDLGDRLTTRMGMTRG